MCKWLVRVMSRYKSILLNALPPIRGEPLNWRPLFDDLCRKFGGGLCLHILFTIIVWAYFRTSAIVPMIAIGLFF